MFDPLSPDLHLLTKFEKWRHSLSCGFGDQDLTSGGVGLNARGEIDLTSDHAILHSLGRTDISQHDLTCVESNAHFQFGQIFSSVLLIDLLHGKLHRYGASNRSFGVILLPDGGTEQDEDRITDELVDGALVLLDYGYHCREISIEQRDHAIRGQIAPIGT